MVRRPKTSMSALVLFRGSPVQMTKKLYCVLKSAEESGKPWDKNKSAVKHSRGSRFLLVRMVCDPS